ncbi:MAG TPA: efflux RND transporter periplasmic adaptor subunit [Terriglobales bacterium]|nr:efflux RND transporter periplasmic adaptor subunit [Terriglobales bacterium]
MTTALFRRATAISVAAFALALAVSCTNEIKAAPTRAEITIDPNLFTVDEPERFTLATVETRNVPTILGASGVVTPDVTRTIHVTSQGSGRVLELRVKLGDFVKKGQVLLSIYSADLAGAFSDYKKAIADERLTGRALARAQLLNSHGALAQKDLETSEDAEDKAKADVQNTSEHVRLLGGDPNHPSSIIEIRAPVSGTIVEQNVAGAEGVKSLDNSPSLFTIADLSQVWVVCDVYENDLGVVHVGDPAEIRLNAYPDRVFQAHVADISRVLDPTLRSAKVRMVLANSDDSFRPGMFATATFRSRKLETRIVVPATSIMRLQDKDWLFRKEGANRFHKLEVHALGTTQDGMQEVRDDVKPGDQVVVNALEFSTAMSGQGK